MVRLSFSFPTEIVEEGEVRVVVPKLEAYKRGTYEYAPSKAPVFYNPVMELNRDLAVITLQTYQNKIGRSLIVSEPLTGCGVRGIRFAKEVEGVERVLLNDLNPLAVELTKHNISLNGLEGKVTVTNEDANLFLSRHAAPHRRFDFIDIDPFGSPSPYIDSAVRALRDGGLIALTATDMAPLCGVYPNVSMRKYGGRSLRTEYCHEIAIRLLTGCLARTAAKHDAGVMPTFSYASDHYIRLYALISHGAREADRTLRMMGYILHCFSCFHREVHPGLVPCLNDRCEECGSRLEVAGPLWLGRLFDKGFCGSMLLEASRRELRNRRRIVRLLTLIREEAEGPITYYVVDKVSDRFNLTVPPLSAVLNKLRDLGFQATPTHFNARGFRTTAPARVVRDVITELAG